MPQTSIAERFALRRTARSRRFQLLVLPRPCVKRQNKAMAKTQREAREMPYLLEGRLLLLLSLCSEIFQLTSA